MSSQNITVLHVDDDEEFTKLVQEFIKVKSDNISVISALNATDALALLESEEDIDCVVSDYEMPHIDGLELLRTVRERWPDLPFILFTGRGDEKIATKAINLGVTDYLQKSSAISQYSILTNRIQNVVSHHRAEVELRQASKRTEAQFELLVDSVEDYAIFLLDTDGTVQTWNKGAEKIKGYSTEEVIGEHISVFYRDEEVKAGIPERNLREATAEGRVKTEGWRVRKDGTEFWADVRITALREEGELVGYAKVTRDSTQRHQEYILAEENEQLKHFISAISHDLKNPLAAAEGSVQLAIESDDISKLDLASQALNRANELLEYLTRVANGGRELTNPEPVNIREVAEESWELIRDGESELRIEDEAVFMADRHAVQQLLDNLLRNAVKYAGSDVTVTVGRLNDGFYLEDDGPGIPGDKRELVFEVGYSDDPDGSGFGLAICKNIVNSNDWFIKVTEGSDGGARFEVTGLTIVE